MNMDVFNTRIGLAALLLGGSLGVNVALAAPAEGLVPWGKINANVRLRYEDVDQTKVGPVTKDADAVTLRTRIGYETGAMGDWKMFAEIEDVTVLDDSYNSTINHQTQYPVVVDPKSTELNQAYITFAGLSDTVFKGGRQRLILDNARFIGNVGWRQNEQTFDAFKITNNSLADTRVIYAYLGKARRVFSDKSPKGKSEMESHLLNVAYSGFDLGTITAYGYWLGFNDRQAIKPAAGTKTFGVSFDGGKQLSENSGLIYRLEFADQSDYDHGLSSNDANYQLGEIGWKYKTVVLKVSQETLEGDGKYGFSTQLATGHKFNGWADHFLATPKDGLEDTFVTAISTLGGVKFVAVYHWFESDHSSYDYGEELDLLAVKKLNKQFTVGAKYADYDTDKNSKLLAHAGSTGPAAIDRKKFWVWGEFNY